MTALSSYSTGTVAVAADGTTVTGTSTLWLNTGNVKPGDLFQSGHFCVPITDVTDDTHLTVTPWPGSTLSGATYTIWKVSQQRIVGETYAKDVDKMVGALNTSGFFVFVDIGATVPDPSLGDDGQHAFQPTTGKTWVKSAGVWSYLGIYKAFQLKGAWSGATAYTVGDVVTLSGSSYACVLGHTNQTPPNTTYWQLLASIGATGNTGPAAWSPPAAWVTATAYAAGPPASVVVQGGETYVCLVSHTSGTFATDLAAAKWIKVAQAGGVSSLNGQSGALSIGVEPQGRLTLVSGLPVMTTSQAAKTTVYYTPYAGNQVPIYDGTNMVPRIFPELSQATTDTTKAPAACAANSNYDQFIGWTGSASAMYRGPAWSSDTSRGTGAGTTELEFFNGFYVNKFAIANGPAARQGIYVGTIRTNGTATVDYIFGSIGVGGVAAVFGVWNAFNRRPVGTTVLDNTNSWTYAINATWRAPNGNATMRVSAVRGLDEDAVEATYYAIARTTAGGTGVSGIGVNTTSAYSGTTTGTINTTDFLAMPARFSGTIGLGYRFVSAIEYNDTTNTTTWRGLIPSLPMQSGLHATLWQ